MKIVICWSSITGYWGACWRALAAQEGVELFVIAFAPPEEAKFDLSVLDGLNYRLLDSKERYNSELVRKLVSDFDPQALLVVGWFVKAYREIVCAEEFSDVKKFMSVDTQWKREAQYLTRFRYRKYFKHLDGAGVSGERSFQYVRRLGIERSNIHRNMYGVDQTLWSPLFESRDPEDYPKRFLFVGRYVEAKAMNVLAEAYRIYRSKVQDPWPMSCCGRGAEGKWIEGIEGIEDHGFVQPEAMREIWLNCSVFVMSSRSDEWPLALVEAAMSGLPIVATDVCGSIVEVVRPHYNGLVVPPEDPEALAKALVACHDAPLSVWGNRARSHALAFTTEMWATRWLNCFRD